MAQLRDMQVASLTAAANEWYSKAGQLLAAAGDLNDLVKARLSHGEWTGPAAQQATARVQVQLEGLEASSAEHKAIAFIMHGIAHAFQISQDSLLSALRRAQAGHFRVDEAGTVYPPNSPMARHDPDYASWCRTETQRLRNLIDQALVAATRADYTGYNALDWLSQRTNVSLKDAYGTDLRDASKLEVDLIAAAVPEGSRDQVATWWASLSDADRQTLKLAVPWALEPLDGIPDDVKKELKGSDEYDRTGVAQWAIDHWDDSSTDAFKRGNNCTDFVSDALARGGGVPEHFWLGNLSDDSWSDDGRVKKYSDSWTQAQASYDFWTEHGREVSQADARPGDIIYWEDSNHHMTHAAVVTSVVDGDIRYTQHSDPRLEASLDGRTPLIDLVSGHETTHIVRPDPDW